MNNKCNVCCKTFGRIYELERHKNKKIKCIPKNIDVDISNMYSSTNSTNYGENNNNSAPIAPILHQQQNDILQDENKCTNCNKIFTRLSSYKRHVLFRCKFIDDKINNTENNNMIEIIQNMNNKIDELQNKIQELKEQKSSQNIINNNTNNTNTNSNNTINNNNNITFNIIKFGDESPAKKLTTKEIQYIINAHRNTMLQRSIEITHFNNKHPEFQNVYISDKKMQNANIYNGDKFDLKSIDFVIDDLILNHINNLDDYKNREDVVISDNKHEEIDTIVDNFQNYRDSGSNKEKRIYKKTELDIKEMLYNNKDKVIETKKKIGRKKKNNKI